MIDKKKRRRFFFKRFQRISKKKEILLLITRGQRFHLKSFRVHFLENSFDFPRLCISIKKQVGSSSTRNQIKRKMREWFRLGQHQLKAYDLFFYGFQKTDHWQKHDWQLFFKNLDARFKEHQLFVD